MWWRCSKCDKRKTMTLAQSRRRNPPCCDACGSVKFRRDRYRENVERKQPPCRCIGGYYTFPHRKGSKWCQHNTTWTAEDAEAEFGVP